MLNHVVTRVLKSWAVIEGVEAMRVFIPTVIDARLMSLQIAAIIGTDL